MLIESLGDLPSYGPETMLRPDTESEWGIPTVERGQRNAVIGSAARSAGM